MPNNEGLRPYNLNQELQRDIERLKFANKHKLFLMEIEDRSHCCGAVKESKSSDEGTGYYVCSKCGEEFLTLDDQYHLSESLRLRLE